MKYLKSYNESLDEICNPISRDEFIIFCKKKKILIDNSDMLIINKIISGCEEICKEYGYEVGNHSYGLDGFSITVPIHKFDAIGCYISKYEDEYYIVEMTTLFLHNGKWTERYNNDYYNNDNAYYLCDQLEGLEEFGKTFINEIEFCIMKPQMPA